MKITLILAADSKVIISDYYYMFNPDIRDTFLAKTNKEIEKSIIIVDEGHNLPLRLRDLFTFKLSSFIIERAIKEAKKFGYNETIENLNILHPPGCSGIRYQILLQLMQLQLRSSLKF